jgi:hypothetical protein
MFSRFHLGVPSIATCLGYIKLYHHHRRHNNNNNNPYPITVDWNDSNNLDQMLRLLQHQYQHHQQQQHGHLFQWD